MQKRLSILLAGLTALSQPLGAVQHLRPGAYPNAFQDKVHAPSPAQIRAAAGSLRAAVISNATGTKTVAVILVQFPAGDSSLISGSPNFTSGLASGAVDTTFQNVTQYYSENSYGKFTVNFKFFGPTGNAAGNPLGETTAQAAGAYTLARPTEYYGCGDEGTGCAGVPTPTSPATGANGNYLIRDALQTARASYPSLRSTNFDSLIVLHAGNGNETSISDGDIWSISYSQDSVILQAGAGFNEGAVVPETESSGITTPLGVICHEFGHAISLPDLYNTGSAGGSSVVGDWDLMDSGPFLGNGANPSHLGAWCKLTLGWATPQTVTNKGSFSLNPIETTPNGLGGLIKLPVQNGLPQEYFLIEYRSRTATGASYDHNIPGDGLLIWHVDDAITSSRGVTASDDSLANSVNTGAPHYGVSIVTADGLTISSANQGDAGNAFGNQGIFVNPKSDTFGGQLSGISIVNIAGIGTGAARLDVANLAITATQSIVKLINYPNPAGKGYPHPSGEGHTTLQFQLTRPANDYQLNIYTLSGDLVRKVSKDQITINVDRSANLKWVYEFDWDLKNGDGALVAPGVYLYLVRADGKTKSAKAAIIR